MDYNKPLNIVLVGDPEVGKSTLISKCHQYNPTAENGGFFTRDFKISSSYKPTSLASHLTSIYQNKGDRSMMYSVFRANIIDTGGGRRYDHVRPLAYIDADVFLVCFDIADRQSFLNVSSRWLPEVKKYESQVPVLLVGTKSDLKSRKQVTEAEIYDTSKSLCQNRYIEISSYDQKGMVCALFDRAVELAFTYRKDHLKSRFKKSKDKNNEQSFDVATMETASVPPECPRGSSTLSSDWQVTLDSKRATDVILKFPDQSPDIHAHKFVLALASTSFRKLFKYIDNMCDMAIKGTNASQTYLPTDETESCKCCANSENNTAQEFDSNFLNETPFFHIHCAHCSCGHKAVDAKEGKNRESFRNEALPIQITFKTCIKRPVFLCVLEWMYTGRLDISDEPELSIIEDLLKILLELDIQALTLRLLRSLRPPPVSPPPPPLPPSARGHNLGQHGNIPLPPPPPPLPPSAIVHNVGQHGNIPIPPPLPPLLPSVRGHNVGQHGNIPIPPPLPPLLPSVRGHNVGQHGNIPIPPPLLPSVRGHNEGQHGNIPIPPPLPPLLPSVRGHNVGQHGNIPIPPPLPPLLPSVRGHNQGKHANIPIPVVYTPPPPRPTISKNDLASAYKDIWENAHSLLIDGNVQPDLVLIVDDTPVHVHRVVLLSRSPVMAAMLDGRFKERDLNTVRLPGVPLDHFRTVLEFMYSDTCRIDETNIKDIMELADRFDVPSLLQRCEEYIIHILFGKTITEDSLERGRDLVMNTIYLSETFNARLLHKWCLHFIATNYDLFEQEEDFKSIWNKNAEYMESNRWPTQNYIQVLKQYKASKSQKLNEMILRKRRSNTTKCACCVM